MADELTAGSVPPYYREVYDIVCPNQESKIDRDVIVKILMKSSLPKQTLSEIWNAVDTKQGYLTRSGLYKALALTALAQQGKPVNDKLLDGFAGQELPKPSLGDLGDLRTLSTQLRRERAPNLLSYNYQQLQELDTVTVNLVPEKKGLLLKHVEYEVKSSFYKSSVSRRYNDFLAFSEALLLRFPYRMVPPLPPKKIGASKEFIENRRKALTRFLTLVVRHPTFHESEVTKFFLTFSGSDMQYKIKEQFRNLPDEFVTSPLAGQSKDLVPMDTQIQFGNSKEQVKRLFYSLNTIKLIVDEEVRRKVATAKHMLSFARELNALGSDTQPVSSWAMGQNEVWPKIKDNLKTISSEFSVLSEKYAQQSKVSLDAVVERLALILDVLQSYRDLCERHEKGVLKDHQSALNKMANIKKKKMTATIKGGEHVGEVEQLSSRITEQESQIMTMENRNYFSLHCLQMETQLVYANIQIVAVIMQALAQCELKGHQELLDVWQDTSNKVSKLPVSGDNSQNNPT
ncbi:Sorting nexin-8 [Holothuria leucospilota]|uniref:Sorting nexin-8 n=1 Tax=Holothuria leucospilota TaxID=206669 RepID=A0A9Q1C1S3_HOLLE|nr:Sorting nexin-8 [Holothuria leucospilota]